MSSRFCRWVIARGTLLVLSACEPSKTAKSKADPPPQAVAPTITKPATEADPPRNQEAAVAAPKSDQVESLVTQVEKEFNAGQANYQAGHLEQAKSNFDHAFNLLLSYPPG